MAGHLLKAGHTMFVHTIGKPPADLTDGAPRSAPPPAPLRERADIIFIMVPDTPDVQEVLFSEYGVASGLAKGKTVVDCSSIDPIATRGFAEQIAALGCDYLDAPVSGGEVGAKAASLTIMVGGQPAAFERIRPLFELMGKNITLVGPAGRRPGLQGGQPDHRGAEYRRGRPRRWSSPQRRAPTRPGCARP